MEREGYRSGKAPTTQGKQKDPHVDEAGEDA